MRHMSAISFPHLKHLLQLCLRPHDVLHHVVLGLPLSRFPTGIHLGTRLHIFVHDKVFYFVLFSLRINTVSLETLLSPFIAKSVAV